MPSSGERGTMDTARRMVTFVSHRYLESRKSNDSSRSVGDSVRSKKSVDSPISSRKRRIQNRLKSSLNNIRYKLEFKLSPSFRYNSPIWLLGNLYSRQPGEVESNDNSGTATFEDFLDDFYSRIWFTYRYGFPSICGSKINSDHGWGCMLRSAQMMLAQALVLHAFGREWSALKNRLSPEDKQLHTHILSQFIDNANCVFSIHRFVQIGLVSFGRPPGSWYGPASAVQILHYAVEQLPPDCDDYLKGLRVYVAYDNVIYLDDIESLCGGAVVSTTASQLALCKSVSQLSLWSGPPPRKSSNITYTSEGSRSPTSLLSPRSSMLTVSSSTATVDETRPWSKAVLLIIPLRLGAEKLNPVYVDHLKAVLSLKQCVGVIGGRPKHSMYFVGWQDDCLIYLDPHYSQRSVDKLAENECHQTYHCNHPRKLPFLDMDPSCAVGFYIRNRHDLQIFLADISQVAEYGCVSTKHPLFTICVSRDQMKRRRGIPKRNSFLIGDFGRKLVDTGRIRSTGSSNFSDSIAASSDSADFILL